MASIIDEAMARSGTISPQYRGINTATAADHEWFRDDHESEHNFLLRVRASAAAAGLRVVYIAGAIQVTE